MCIQFNLQYSKKFTANNISILFYLELFGLFPIHNSFLIVADFLIDFYNNLVSGSSSTDFVKQKLELLCECEGLSDTITKNIDNHTKNISRACIAVLALLITPEDLDQVVCFLCGACPKIVNRKDLWNVQVFDL